MQLPSISAGSKIGDANYKPPASFPIGPFTKYDKNPILKPNPDNDFEAAYIYNATAIVADDKVFLLYRAQNAARTSTVGIAWSDDGYNFTRYHKPVLYPTEAWEQGGGCEDPRVAYSHEHKMFVMTYTAYDRSRARLCTAVSDDLFHWKKYPPVVNDSWHDVARDWDGRETIRQAWTKAGAVFTDRHKNGKYYMIWGDSDFHLAESEDLKHWKLPTYSYINNTFARGVHPWQDKLIEPGAAPIKLEYPGSKKNHYILFYNSATLGSSRYAKDTYTISQMLVDYDDLSGPVARLEKPILVPDSKNELIGQVNKVVFTEGIVQFKGTWFLYFGQGDSELGVATANAE